MVALVAVLLSYFSNFWFPWLVIAGGQVALRIRLDGDLPMARRGGSFQLRSSPKNRSAKALTEKFS